MLLVAHTGFAGKIFFEFVRFILKRVCVDRRWLLGRYVGPAIGVLAIELQPLLNVRFRIRLYGVDGALRFTDTAVDALIWMNDEHVVAFIEAIDRTNLDAIGVFALDAVFIDDVGHSCSWPLIRLRR